VDVDADRAVVVLFAVMRRSDASAAAGTRDRWIGGRTAAGVGLALILLAGLLIRLHNFPDGGRYSDTGTGYYAADSAMRYRYARMIAEGREIPAVDRSIQYPEGLRVRSLLFLLGDRVAGYSWRAVHAFLPAIDFDAWLRLLICVSGALAAAPVFLLARHLWRSVPAGLAGAAVYITAIPSFGRSAGSYLREELVLPLLLAGLYLFLRSRADGRERTLIPAGACFLAALSMWHMTQFFLLVFAVFTLVFSLATSDRRLARALMVLALFAAAAGWINEPLRSRDWIAGPPMLLLYAFSAAWLVTWGRGKGGRLRLALFGLFTAAFIAFVRATQGTGPYTHVFSLLLAKVRFLGRAPADPARIAFDVRALWTGPFDGPGAARFCAAFALPLLLSLYPAWRLIASLRGRELPGSRAAGGAPGAGRFDRFLILWLALAFLPLYGLVTRLEVFLIPFVAVLAAGVVRVGPRALRLALPAILLFMGVEAWHYADGTREAAWWSRVFPGESGRPRTPRDRDVSILFDLIETATEPDAVILARYPVSPMILAYTGRRVVVHPIFESAENRRKIEAVTTAAFGDAEAYHELCLELGAGYVLYEANTLFDTTPGFDRYMTATRAVDPRSAVYRMHFFPERLDGFRLVGQTRYFRLFRVEGEDGLPPREGGMGAGGTGPGGYSAQFDPGLFGARPEEPPDDERIHAALDRIAGILEAYNRGYAEYRAGRYGDAVRTLRPVVRAMPRLDDARLLLLRGLLQTGNLSYRAGRFPDAAQAYAEAARLDPGAPMPRLLTGSSLAAQGRYEEAEAEFLAAVSLDPENPEAHEKLGMVYIETGDPVQARRHLERALELDPGQGRVRRLLESLR
jgi:tetratricopeptide (TPR) repeat protein